MSATLDELERLLGLLVSEQRKLRASLDRQRAAMQSLDARSIEQIVSEQEGIRTRVVAIETRRRAISLQAARELRLQLAPNTDPSLTQLMSVVTDPLRRGRLQVLRDELRQVLQELAASSHVAGRLAGAVLGHLNTAMRVLQSAMRDAGTYSKTGAPKMGGRLGALEAVG